MIKKILAGVLLLSSFGLCEVINIAVAANVSYAIPQLKKEFNKMHPDIEVRVILGSSGKLTAQIKYGAPYGLFMSANMKYPEALHVEKIAITKPVVYAQGSLAILSNRQKDFSRGIELSKDISIDKIAIANPKTAPYGKATVEAFKNANIYEEVKGKFVYGESISQTVSYAVTATDLGFIAKSSLYSPNMKRFKKSINWVDVDSKLYTPINQGVVILKNAQNSKGIKAFYDFILSPKARKIFEAYGYIVP
jgi:molybdate transport system substrate-binding protein